MSDLRLHAVTDHGPVALPVPPGAAAFRDLYRGLSLGVYTAFRTHDHRRFLHLDRHLARLRDSMRRLGWKDALDEPRLRRALDRVCTAHPAPETRVRVDVLAEPEPTAGARELIALLPFTPPPAALYRDGVAVRTTREIARTDPLAKTADFVERRAGLEARLADAHEYLMVDAQGRVLEGLRSNFYAVLDGRLRTAADSALRGVTRGVLLGLAREMGIPVDLDAVRADDLGRLEEAAISASSQGLVPVVRIDGAAVGEGRPGPIVRRLVAAYDAHVAAHLRPAVEEGDAA